MSPSDARRRPAWDPDGAQTSRQTSVDPDGTRPDWSAHFTCGSVDEVIASCAAFDAALDRLAVCRVGCDMVGVEGADASDLELLVSHWVADVVTGAPLLFTAVAERVDAHGVQPVRGLKRALVLLPRGVAA